MIGHVIQIALFATALINVLRVLAEAIVDPRCRAVLRQLLTGQKG